MTAYISGQAGIAACCDGNVWFVLRVGEKSPSPSSGTVARRILASADDLREVQIESLDELPALLDSACRQESALLYLTATLEGIHSADLTARMLATLRDVEPGAVLDFLRNRLYAAVMPPGALDAVRRLIADLGADHCLAALLSDTLQDQRAIQQVREIWEGLPSAKFAPPASKEDWRWRLADEGWNWRLATRSHPEDVVSQAGTERDFVVDWAARLATIDTDTRAGVPSAAYEPRSMMAA